MNARLVSVAGGRRAAVAELGSGAPVLYLHDFIDVFSDREDWFPLHRAIAERRKVVAFAHAGCAESDEDEDAVSADDAVFHVLETLDAVGLGRLPVIGAGIGGWIAAELAVRHPDLVERLVLVGATGLFVPQQPIADIFYATYPIDGENFDELRRMLFAEAASPLAHEHVPNGRMSIEREMLRYRMIRFANRLGFKPPYLYDRQLVRRLSRYRGPSLVLWGERDGLVPPAHARTYAQTLPNATLRMISGAGHSIHLEAADEVAREITTFLDA